MIRTTLLPRSHRPFVDDHPIDAESIAELGKSRGIRFDAHGFLDLDRQLEEARLRMDVSSADITAEDLSPEEQLAREAKTWVDRQGIGQECGGEPGPDLRL